MEAILPAYGESGLPHFCYTPPNRLLYKHIEKRETQKRRSYPPGGGYTPPKQPYPETWTLN